MSLSVVCLKGGVTCALARPMCGRCTPNACSVAMSRLMRVYFVFILLTIVTDVDEKALSGYYLARLVVLTTVVPQHRAAVDLRDKMTGMEGGPRNANAARSYSAQARPNVPEW